MLRLWLLLCFVQLSIFAQNNYQITGEVFDASTQEALEFVDVIATSEVNTNVLYAAITDATGSFVLSVPEGNYEIKIAFFSYQNLSFQKAVFQDLNLGKLNLKLDTQQLGEVTIVSEKAALEFKPDKKVYNLAKDATSVGANVSEVLNNVPSVAVDVEGNVSIRGNENIRILIDGKPSALLSSDPASALAQLPADIVEKVEVITSPSAKYDASGTGGILNIVLKKAKAKGTSGTLNLTMGVPTQSNASANLNYRTPKYSLSTNIASFYRGQPGELNFDNTYDDSALARIDESRTIDREDIGGTVNVGIDYYLNKNTTLKANAFSRIAEEKDRFENTSLRFSETALVGEQFIDNPQREWDRSIQLDFGVAHNFKDKNKRLTADLQLGYDKENADQIATTFDRFDNDTVLAEERVNSIEWERNLLAQVDYVSEKDDRKFETGYRATLNSETKDYALDDLDTATQTYSVNEDLTNVFDYRTRIHAAYAQYQNRWKKLSAVVGLRLEYTELEGEISTPFDTSALQELIGEAIQLTFKDDYLAPFPTLNLAYDFSKQTQVSAGVNRRIRRPRGFFLNPFPSRSSQTNIFQGNPTLLPVFSTNYEIGVLHKWSNLTLNASVYYQHAPNYFHVVHETVDNAFVDGVPVIRAVPINIEKSERRGAELNIMYNPWPWWRLNLGLNGYFFEYTGDYNGTNFDSLDDALKTNFSSKIKLPKQINWQTNFTYTAGRRTAQTFYAPRYRLDLALSKEFTEHNLNVSFRVTDLFNTNRRRFETIGEDFTTEGDLLFRKRQFALSLVYKINPEQYKKTKTKRTSFSESGTAY